MSAEKKQNHGLRRLLNRDVHIARLLALMAVWLVFLAFTAPKFFRVISFQTMASQFPEFGVMALGVMLCMITGGIDLSVVGVANFTGVTMGMLLKVMVDGEGQLMWYAIPAVIVIGICVGAVCGLFNGFLISKVPIPPILATLGSFELFTGISVIITNGKAVAKLPMRYAEVLAGRLGPVPVQAVIFILVAIVVGVLLSKTSYGLKIYMLGTSERAARYSGLRVDWLLLQTYMISGMCAAIGGLIMLSNYNTARADFGLVYTLQCVLIVVLGGVSPTGGKGKLTGVLLSICMLQLLSSGLNRFPQINSFFIPLIWGGVLLLVMVLDFFTDKTKINKRGV